MSVDKQMLALFTDAVKDALKEELPGEAAQLKMTPELRKGINRDETKRHRLGGVLIVLYLKNDIIHTILTQRWEYNGHHSGQISFPGGKKDKTDKNLKQTALREACEELGLCSEDIEVLGELSPLYIPPSGFLVSPFVAFIENLPRLKRQISEVREIIEVPLSMFLKPEFKKKKMIKLADDMESETPYYDIFGKVVWGATAMIMSEFEEIVNKIVTPATMRLLYDSK